MCIMEVRAGQHASTIAQALAHNIKTSQGDLEMFRTLLIARGDVETLSRVEHAQELINSAYEYLLGAFGRELAHDIDHGHGHNPDQHIGNERDPRSIVIHSRPDAPCSDCGAIGQHSHVRTVDREMVQDAAERAATLARRYETR